MEELFLSLNANGQRIGSSGLMRRKQSFLKLQKFIPLRILIIFYFKHEKWKNFQIKNP